MVKKLKSRTLKSGIPAVFTLLALAVLLGTPASIFAADQGWHDPAPWFSQGGTLPHESDWYSATYGYGSGDEVRYYYQDRNVGSIDAATNTGRSRTEKDSMYGGYGPVDPGFAEIDRGLDRSYTSSYYREHGKADDHRSVRGYPGARNEAERESNMYGGYGPIQPGFEKFDTGAGQDFERRSHASADRRMGPRNEAERESNMYGGYGPINPGFEKFDNVSTYRGYYEGAMMDEPNYYTKDWDRRGGDFDSWW